MKKIYFSFLFALLLVNAAVSQTTINTTVGSTGYIGGFSSGTNSFITFVVENSSPSVIIVDELANLVGSADNGQTISLYYTLTELSGPPTLDISGLPSTGWTLACAPQVLGGVTSPTVAVNTVMTGINFPVSSGTTYRFCLFTTGTNTYSGPPASPNTFTNGGVSLMLGDVQIAGQNVGYGGPNNPRFFTGSITYSLAVSGGGPATVPPIASFAYSDLDTVWINSPHTVVNTSNGSTSSYWDIIGYNATNKFGAYTAVPLPRQLKNSDGVNDFFSGYCYKQGES
jgi:hypothetical protein